MSKLTRTKLIVISIIFVLTIVSGVIVAEVKSNDIAEATPDQATVDQLETIGATPSQIETEPPTEAETEKPTKKPTEPPTEKKSENVVYTQIDHGSVGKDVVSPTEKPEDNENNKQEQTQQKEPPKTENKDETPKQETTATNKSDVELLARLIYLEGGNCSEYCQWLIGSTAMNLADINGGLSAVAYNYNIFNVAYKIDSCTPSALSRKVAERVLSGDRDYNVKAFRMWYYHSFGTPYTTVDNVYFSTY
jgi:type IV secretory pathway VirB10-like protein